MRGAFLKSFIIVSLFFLLLGDHTLPAAGSPVLPKVKQHGESKGFIMVASHDEIVAKAKKEGNLRALSGWDPAVYPHLVAAFKKKYPFINIHLEELTGTDAAQRFVMEMKADAVKNWDVVHINTDFYQEFPPYLQRFDILAMAREKILGIPIAMIDPKYRNLVALGSAVDVTGYNKNLISSEKVPANLEEFLKPEFKGKKIVVDIRPLALAALVPKMGLEWVLEYSRKLAAQEPVWARGFSRAYAAIAAGEYPLHHLGNYNSIARIMQKDPTASLQFKVVEPVPVRIHEPQGVYHRALHPYTALLWLEFQASSEAQKIIDEYEPLKASIFAPGSELEKLIKGKQISVNSWDTWEPYTQWVKLVVGALGFPTAQLK
ncbi:MAG: ABC transporter substrate-binding protein [Candidatus Binatia bacterium]